MFIQTRGPPAACFLNDYVLKNKYNCFKDLGAPWSSGARGPGPNGPVVNPPLYVLLNIEAMHVTSSTGCAAIVEISTASTLDLTGLLSVVTDPKRWLLKPYYYDGQLL